MPSNDVIDDVIGVESQTNTDIYNDTDITDICLTGGCIWHDRYTLAYAYWKGLLL